MYLPNMFGIDWVKVGTRIRAIEDMGEMFNIPKGTESEIRAIVTDEPLEVEHEGNQYVFDDLTRGSIIVGWFPPSMTGRSTSVGGLEFISYQFMGDLVGLWEPIYVPPMDLSKFTEPTMIRPPWTLPPVYGKPGGLPLIGFWRSCQDPEACYYWISYGARLPWPEAHVDMAWDPAEKNAVLAYFEKAGTIATRWKGVSSCRCCGRSNGNTTMTDGTYLWPSGFGHYIAEHGVRPPADFIQHVRSRA